MRWYVQRVQNQYSDPRLLARYLMALQLCTLLLLVSYNIYPSLCILCQLVSFKLSIAQNCLTKPACTCNAWKCSLHALLHAECCTNQPKSSLSLALRYNQVICVLDSNSSALDPKQIEKLSLLIIDNHSCSF